MLYRTILSSPLDAKMPPRTLQPGRHSRARHEQADQEFQGFLGRGEAGTEFMADMHARGIGPSSGASGDASVSIGGDANAPVTANYTNIGTQVLGMSVMPLTRRLRIPGLFFPRPMSVRLPAGNGCQVKWTGL